MRYLKREIILYIGEDSWGYPLLLVCVKRSWRASSVGWYTPRETDGSSSVGWHMPRETDGPSSVGGHFKESQWLAGGLVGWRA